MKFLITGGAGFIGSALIRFLIKETDHHVMNIDCLTYAGHLDSLNSINNNSRYIFKQINICDGDGLQKVFTEYQPDFVMHLAAESHVDRSIFSPQAFIQTNIVGTYQLLEASRLYWLNLSQEKKEQFRFHHISTDEVFGDLEDKDALFTEKTAYAPNSPYSASKASSDHLVRAWHRTYQLPIIITNCSNNYGPYQFPEKLIPLMILNAINNKPLPVYGDGGQIRDWLYVEDHVSALYEVVTKGRIGETYNIGGDCERQNIEVVHLICDLLETIVPLKNAGCYRNLIQFISDRPGHDRRYAIDASKIKRELHWQPKETFESGIRKTIHWYLDNLNWCDSVLKKFC